MKIKNWVFPALLLSSVLCLPSSVFAQAPWWFNYQARLTSGSNTFNGTIGLSLRLFDADTLGNLLYEDSNTVTVVDGLYTTYLGDNTTFGSLGDALTNGNLYMETMVNGVALTPRDRMVTVPYAIRADTLDGLDSTLFSQTSHAHDASTLVSGTILDARLGPNVSLLGQTIESSEITDGTIGNGDLAASSVNSSNIVDGTIQLADISSNGASAGQIMKWNGSAWVVAGDDTGSGGQQHAWLVLGTNMAATNTGNVGIGTAAPSAPLHVVRNGPSSIPASSNSIAILERQGTGLLSILTPSNAPRGILFGDEVNSSHGAIIYNSTTTNGFQFRTGGNSTRMVITSNGLVGINSTTPIGSLEVGARQGGTVGSLVTNLVHQVVLGGAFNSGANGNGVKLWIGDYSNDGETNYPIYVEDENNLVEFYLRVKTSESARATAFFGGNVGIGVTNPVSRLEVAGNAVITGSITAASLAGNGAGVTNVTPPDGSVTGAKIADGAVGNADLAPNAVGSDKIADGAVSNSDLSAQTLSNTFWRLGGNTGTASGSLFLGTADGQALAIHASEVLITNDPAAFLRASSTGDVVVTLEADTDNSVEQDNPRIDFSQDGGAAQAMIGMEGIGGATATGSVDNAFLVGGKVAAPVQIMVNNDVKMSIRSTGNVGIGVTNPAERLDVDGNVVVTGSVTAAFFTGAGGAQFQVKIDGLQALLVTGSDGAPNIVIGATKNHISNGTVGASILGGSNNFIDIGSDYSVIGGGRNHFLLGNSPHSVIAGGHNNMISSNAEGAAIGGGVFSFVGPGAENGTVGGGLDNNIRQASTNATIAGGAHNNIDTNGVGSFIGGGRNNTIHNNASDSVISGGQSNEVNSDYATIAGGKQNYIDSSAVGGTIGGGSTNVVGFNADDSVIGGGQSNVIGFSARWAVIPGGRGNFIGEGAEYAFAAGHNARATNVGSFVWNHNSSIPFASTMPNQFIIKADGGVGINTNNPTYDLDINGDTIVRGTLTLGGDEITIVNGASLTPIHSYYELDPNPSGTNTHVDLDSIADGHVGQILILNNISDYDAIYIHGGPDANCYFGYDYTAVSSSGSTCGPFGLSPCPFFFYAVLNPGDHITLIYGEVHNGYVPDPDYTDVSYDGNAWMRTGDVY